MWSDLVNQDDKGIDEILLVSEASSENEYP
jgi:hypothetical protein